MAKQGVGITLWWNRPGVSANETGGTESLYGAALDPLLPFGASQVTGSPGDPALATIWGFAATSDDLGTVAAPCPYDSPTFLGFLLRFVQANHGIAICTGPEPDTSGPTVGFIDPADLTTIKSWYFPADDDNAVASWVPLTSGEFYYVVVEGYDPDETPVTPDSGLPGSIDFIFTPAATAHVTELDGVDVAHGSEIAAINTPVTASTIVEMVACPATLDIDWGDGTTTSTTVAGDPVYDILTEYIDGGGIPADGGPLPDHTYTARGLYTITATITDAVGGTSHMDTIVAVVHPPTCQMKVQPHTAQLGGFVTISHVAGHSDAWDLMHARDPDTNPDGYDPTRTDLHGPGHPAHTAWELSQTESGFDAYADADGTVYADWFGPGLPFNDITPTTPPPTRIYFPDTSRNRSQVADGQRALITLIIADVYRTWQQDATVEIHIALGVSPPQRQFPRDDGLGISTRRSWPPNISQQHGLRRGTVNTYQ